MKISKIKFVLLANVFNVLAVYCSTEAPGDFSKPSRSSTAGINYKRYLVEPELMMSLPSSEREEVLARISAYRQITVDAVKMVKTEATAVPTRSERLVLAKSFYDFYLELKFKEQEILQKLTAKKDELLKAFTEITKVVGERKEAAKVAYLALDARIRNEERSIFGAIKDVGRGITLPPVPADAKISLISRERLRTTVRYLDDQIEDLCRKIDETNTNLTNAKRKVELLEKETASLVSTTARTGKVVGGTGAAVLGAAVTGAVLGGIFGAAIGIGMFLLGNDGEKDGRQLTGQEVSEKSIFFQNEEPISTLVRSASADIKRSRRT